MSPFYNKVDAGVDEELRLQSTGIVKQVNHSRREPGARGIERRRVKFSETMSHVIRRS